MAGPTIPPATERLRFRPYTDHDTGLVVDLFNDRYAKRFYPSMASAEAARGWIGWNLQNYRKHGFGLWVVEDVETGEPLGDCGLTIQDVGGSQMVEVGYHILKEHRGKGLATEAAGACVIHALDGIGFSTVCSIIDPTNDASIRVAERIHTVQSSFVNQRGETMLLFRTRSRDRQRLRGPRAV